MFPQGWAVQPSTFQVLTVNFSDLPLILKQEALLDWHFRWFCLALHHFPHYSDPKRRDARRFVLKKILLTQLDCSRVNSGKNMPLA